MLSPVAEAKHAERELARLGLESLARYPAFTAELTDLRVTAGGVWELLQDARTLLPGLTELEFAEAIAGLRPGTPDNAPVLGPSGPPGLVLATGHFRNGVLLAPATADIIAEYLVTGQLPAIAAPFSAARFSGVPDGARESRGQP